MSRYPNPALSTAAILMIVLVLRSDLAYASWLSEITGVDINVPSGTISFSNPKPEAIPEMLKNLPVDVLEFATNCLLTRGVCPGVWMATLVRQAKAQAQAGAQPMPAEIRSKLVNFFPSYILDKARWILADPSRSPLEGMIFGGGCPDVQIFGLRVSCSNGALTLDNIIVFKDQDHQQWYELWAHELTHVSQYDGMGIDGFAFAYTLDPGSLEGQAYAWEDTVASAGVNTSQSSQPTQQRWTMPAVRRIALTPNDFASAKARVLLDQGWLRTHSGWGREGDCGTMVGPGTDTGISVQDSDRHFNAGRSYENTHNWVRAIAEYRDAVRLNPANAIAFDRLGLSLTNNGQAQDGVVEIKRAICLSSSKSEYRGDLASAYLASGNIDGAIIEYQIALWFSPRNTQYHRDLGVALDRRGDTERANMQRWDLALLTPASPTVAIPKPPLITTGQPRLPFPAWLKPITWVSEQESEWYATIAGRGCRLDVTKQVLFDAKADDSLMVYTEDSLLSDNVSDFCLDHSDDPAIKKHINMRFRITLAPKQDGTISVEGALEDPCNHCSLPQYLPRPTLSGVIIRRIDPEFWLSVTGAVNGGFPMRPSH